MALYNDFDLAPGNLEKGYRIGNTRIMDLLFVACINGTAATSFALQAPARNQTELKYTADANGMVAISGATLKLADLGGVQFNILGIQFKVPAGLTATNGDKLRVSTAAATDSGSTAVAANTTYAAQTIVTEMAYVNNGSALSGNVGASFTADQTLKLYSVTPGSPDVLGNAVSSASGVKCIPVIITVAAKMPSILPDYIPGTNARIE